MKNILFLSIIFLSLTLTAEANTISLEYGTGSKLMAVSKNNNNFVGVSLSTDFNHFKFNTRIASFGNTNLISASVGMYSTSTVYFGASVGGALLSSVPDGLTGKTQFELGLESGYKVNDKINISVFAVHYSNGADLNIGNYPNDGYDFVGVKTGYNF